MRRQEFTLNVTDIDWVDDDDAPPERPTVTIDFTGSAALEDRLTDADGDLLDGDEIDVAFRLQGDVDDQDTTGVVAVTHRLTGDFVLELNEDADDVLQFIRAAREYGRVADTEKRYRVHIHRGGEHVVTYEKDTFLVYNTDGDLLRRHSLIPSGIEI
ncbi:DUF5793 family protein [Salarchaeum sp. JOR-1]|uniref:DUF5793 family protein n=1 Tax=Salarchaeum sp. JOR-1 TaxID=2599399 RepID=UPI0011986072|nr:DUF5793 family protein [Salarchaeum sp. JOR-1]QDX41322.1 hypothetical protein FQU85_10595 [Salarchaeum sp. JOR-1]